MGAMHTLWLTKEGTIYGAGEAVANQQIVLTCALSGQNSYAQLGTNDRVQKRTPVLVPFSQKVKVRARMPPYRFAGGLIALISCV